MTEFKAYNMFTNKIREFLSLTMNVDVRCSVLCIDACDLNLVLHCLDVLVYETYETSFIAKQVDMVNIWGRT